MPDVQTGLSFWVATGKGPDYPPLDRDMAVDVAVIGGGIVGLTAALEMAKQGRSVAVLEARKLGQQATGRSTAKASSQHNCYVQLIDKFGADKARLYAQANQSAIGTIESIVHEHAIDCDFSHTAAFAYATSDETVSTIEQEAEAARSLGLPAELVRSCAIPVEVKAALRFTHQAELHVCKYLNGVARAVAAAGGKLFEATRATSVEPHGDVMHVATERGTVTAADVIVATQMPVIPDGMYFAKAFPYSHPLAAAPVESAKAPQGMFISLDKPTHSFRSAHDGDLTYVVAAGNTYRTGNEEEAQAAADDLRAFLANAFGIERPTYLWASEDFMSMDGLPFVGRASDDTPHLFVATGFNAWGITNGTVAGVLLADAVAGKPNDWANVFSTDRAKPLSSAMTFATENLHVAEHFVGGYAKRRPHTIADVQSGEGAVLKLDGERVAVSRMPDGTVHAVSAICTHLGCIVGWNPIDGTWDCPCHGSRFTSEGEVLYGPAVSPLERKPASSG